MLPVGTRVKVTCPDRSASMAAWTYEGQEGITKPGDSYLTAAMIREFTQVKLDSGVSVYVYDRELQVVKNQPSIETMNGRVTIGDTVCWPQRTGSNMWMVIGTVVDIDNAITDISPVGNMVPVGDGTFSMGFTVDKTVSKITIMTPDGVKKSTKSIDRVVKACPIST